MQKLITVAVALTLLGSSAALAQPDGRRGNDDYRARPYDNNYYDSRDYLEGRQNRPRWSKGDRIADQYRDRGFIVSDWRGNHLRRPPRGYHWLQVENRYFLTNARSGIILDVYVHDDGRDRDRWSRGDRLNDRYRDRQYVVSDWRANRLREPPRGHQWVRVNDQYLLTVIATGIIADMIINNQR